MWSYYGGKGRVVDFYPKPTNNKIIEPFCGSARYSFKHFENDVYLYDVYNAVIECWKYLQLASVKDIMSLPRLERGTRFGPEDFSCVGEYYLFGYMNNQAAAYARSQVSKWGYERFISTRKRIANNLFKIRHWNIALGNYMDIKDEKATWFIDAPYQQGGHKYKYNKINYEDLKDFCLSRSGQVIVCENTGANWMEFTPISKMKGVKFTTTEAIYTNYPTVYDNKQLEFQFNNSHKICNKE